jgi:hypothetical protein
MRTHVLVRHSLRLAAAVVVGGIAFGCSQAPRPPAFEGRQNDSWLAYEVAVTGRESGDLIESFEANAKGYGCTTGRLGQETDPMIAGEIRRWYGVNATCDATRIALIAETDGHVVVGCSRPTTRAGCDDLLQRICAVR